MLGVWQTGKYGLEKAKKLVAEVCQFPHAQTDLISALVKELCHVRHNGWVDERIAPVLESFALFFCAPKGWLE
jgi:hypothetical protein